MRVKIIEPTVKIEAKKKKVCGYARVSTDRDKQGESLENQIQYYENLISNNPEYEYAGVFSDYGITGTTDNRPEFQRMLELCREGKIDLIITKSISRLSRNTALTLEIVRELKDIDVEIWFQRENLKTLSGDGEVMISILSSFAEEESRSVSENVKWRYRKKFERGEVVINTNRFLGYDKDAYGDLVINPKEAEIVKRIYEEYLSGKGAFTIARILNDEGMPTVTGAKWYDTSVTAILKNEKYRGDVMQQKTYTVDHISKKKKRNNGELDSFYIEDNHPAIISKEAWEQAQIEMQKRAEAKGNAKGSTKYLNRYPLSGLLICGKCGAVLMRRTWNSKHSCKKIMWQCSNYIKNGKDACNGISIEDDVVNKLNISEKTVIKEENVNGEKRYSYTSESKYQQSCREYTTTEKENGCVLQGQHRPIRTVIKL